MRWKITVGVTVVASAFLTTVASADAPISLASAVPAKMPGPTKRVVIAAAPAPSVTGEVVSSWLPSGQGGIPVCTTFPGTVSIDRAGNVYKQPVETDAQGRERAVGAPVALAPFRKTVGGITETHTN